MPFEKSFQFFGQLPKCQRGSAFFRRDDQIRMFGQDAAVQTEKLANTALQAVARHRRPGPFPDGDPQPPVGEVVGENGDPKMRGLESGAFPGNPLKFGTPADPLLSAERVWGPLPGRSDFRRPGFNIGSPLRSVFFFPSPFSASEPAARLWWPCAAGNHGFSFGECCSAEKFSSPLHSCACFVISDWEGSDSGFIPAGARTPAALKIIIIGFAF